jgi:hypothetical protein
VHFAERFVTGMLEGGTHEQTKRPSPLLAERDEFLYFTNLAIIQAVMVVAL